MSLTKREMAFGIVRPPKGDYIVAQYKLGVFYYKEQGVVIGMPMLSKIMPGKNINMVPSKPPSHGFPPRPTSPPT